MLRGGENLLDKVEALEAAAAAHAAALAAQRAQQAEQERRIAQLEEANLNLEGKYSSVQVQRGQLELPSSQLCWPAFGSHGCNLVLLVAS